MAGIMDVLGGLLGPAVDALKGDVNKPRPGIIESIGSRLMGPGAFGDPLETFRMYAPPDMAQIYSPEEQIAYGKQIQNQMRKINADYRPTYPQIQQGMINSATYGDQRRTADLAAQQAKIAQQQALRDQAMIGSIFGGGGMPQAVPQAGDAPVEQTPLSDARAVPGAPGEPDVLPNALVVGNRIGHNSRKTNAQKYFEAAQYYASSGRADLAKKYHDIGISLDPNPSEDIRSLEYITGTSYFDSGEVGINDLKQFNESKANRTSVNVTNNAPQAKGDEDYWKTLAKSIPEKEAQAVAANRTNLALRDMLELNNKGTFSGMLAPGAIGATQFLQSFGMNPAQEKLANTREFQASANILVLDFMGAMGGARGFSKEESAILYDAFPKIIDDPKARARIASMLVTRNNRIIDEYKALTRQYEGGGGRPLPKLDVEPLDLGSTGSGGWSIKKKAP